MNEVKLHPLTEVIIKYIQDFSKLKLEYEDLDNLNFHHTHGFSIGCPLGWPLYESLNTVCGVAAHKSLDNVVVVYSSTHVYNRVVAAVNQPVMINYFSWHEFFTAMHLVNEDTRLIKQLKNSLAKADLVIFLGASEATKDVVSQIQASINGCLLLFT